MPIKVPKNPPNREPFRVSDEFHVSELNEPIDSYFGVLEKILLRNLKGRLKGEARERDDMLSSPAFKTLLDIMARTKAQHAVLQLNEIVEIYERGQSIEEGLRALIEEHATAHGLRRQEIEDKVERLYFQLEVFYQLCQNIWHRCARTASQRIAKLSRKRIKVFGKKDKYGDFPHYDGIKDLSIF